MQLKFHAKHARTGARAANVRRALAVDKSARPASTRVLRAGKRPVYVMWFPGNTHFVPVRVVVKTQLLKLILSAECLVPGLSFRLPPW